MLIYIILYILCLYHHFPEPIALPAPQKSCEALAKSSGSSGSTERFDANRERDEILKRITKASGV